MNDSLCYLNGEYLPLSQAKVSVLDRGFIFGDGIYDVAPAYGRRLFRFGEHMARLERGLAKIRITNPHTRDEWLERCRTLVAAVAESSGAEDQVVYIQVTRGVAPRDHVMPEGVTPTVFMMSNPMKPPSAEQRHQGVACTTARDFRWERGDIKTTSLLGGVMARQIAADHGAAETILLRDSGHGLTVTEGSSSNVWAVLDGALIGVPPSHHTLAGIRIELLRELCEEEGIACHLRPIAESELTIADEILISSAGREILPVTRLDGEPVGHGALRGKPGPVYARLHAAYERAKLEQSI